MKLIVGLGNPGKKYIITRHNTGFMVIDALTKGAPFQKKHKSLIQKKEIRGQTVLLAKPQTFMNLSGTAVREIVSFYKIPVDDLLVIQDDKDLMFSKIKFQKSRGDGGHNGIRNIHEELNTNRYARLKIGVGPSPTKQTMKEGGKEEEAKKPWLIEALFPQIYRKDSGEQSTVRHVLSPFNAKEIPALSDLLKNSAEAVCCFIENDFEKAAGRFNQRGNGK